MRDLSVAEPGTIRVSYAPLSIVLLAHNVADRLMNYTRELADYCSSRGRYYSITIIDCASNDRTLALAEVLARDIPEVRVIYRQDADLRGFLTGQDSQGVGLLIDLARQPDVQSLTAALSDVDSGSWELVAAANQPAHRSHLQTLVAALTHRAPENLSFLVAPLSALKSWAERVAGDPKEPQEELRLLYSLAPARRRTLLLRARQESPAVRPMRQMSMAA